MYQEAGLDGLEALLVFSAAMAQKAREGSWDDVVALEGERRAKMIALFSKPIEGVTEERLAAVIRAVLEHDAVVARLATERRDIVARELETLGRGKGAIRAYSES